MINKIRISIIIFITFSAPAFPSPDSINFYFINSAKIARPSVVSIGIYLKTSINEKINFKKVADATGTIISENGDIITNYHVVNKGNYFEISDYHGITYQAIPFENNRLFLADIKTDIAVLRIDNPSNYRFKPVIFGNSNDLSVGEWVLAIGNPYGLNQSISSGIISSIGRDNIGFTDIEDFIQTDVSINPGNSGGPLVNLHGSMVGINTAIRSVSGGSQGISFAIPSNIVRQVYVELKTYGRVRRGWLGFIAKENKNAGIQKKSNLEIISVIKNSPAFAAGIRKGDQIKKINGIDTSSLGNLIKLVASKPVGSKIYITIAREGKILDFKLTLREQHDYNSIRKSLEYLFDKYGFEVEENAESENVIISYISPNRHTTMLKRGDIILSINDIKVFTLEDFIEKLKTTAMKLSHALILRNSRIIEINFDSND